MNKPETVDQYLHRAIEVLRPVSSTAELDTRILFRHLSGMSSVDLILKSNQSVGSALGAQYWQLVEQRRTGVPVALLTGTKEFWSLELKVTKDTLIPRPETELLVEVALERVNDQLQYQIADLGTGSGAIAIAIAKERPECNIIATDICKKALTVARENASVHNLDNISFIESNWFGALPEQKFDIILSNPPYIDMDNDEYNTAELSFEPATALFANNNGLAAIDEIIRQSPIFLKTGGWLLIEHGNTQKQSVHNSLEKAGFSRFQTFNDLNQQPRVSAGMLSGQETSD